MFSKKRTLFCAILFYVLSIGSFVPTIIYPTTVTPFTILAPVALVAAIAMTVVYVRMIKKEKPILSNILRETVEKEKLSVQRNAKPHAGIDVQSVNNHLIFVGAFDLGELGVVKGENVDLSEALSEQGGTDAARAAVDKLQADIRNYGYPLKNYYLLLMLCEAEAAGIENWRRYRKNKYSDEQCLQIFDSAMNDVDLEAEGAKYDEYGLAAENVTDIELFIKEKMPFFDIDTLMKSLRLESLSIDSDGFSLQLSDKTSEIFCGAYERFEDWIPQDWHNF